MPGFTMVELVVVIVVLAVIAAVAIPRRVAPTGFESRAFADEVAAALRHGQRTAIAMRRPVTVSGEPPLAGPPCALRLCLAADCVPPLVDPASGQPFCLQAPGQVTLSAPTLSFDTLGRPSSRTIYTISTRAADVPPRTIVIEAETGYVH